MHLRFNCHPCCFIVSYQKLHAGSSAEDWMCVLSRWAEPYSSTRALIQPFGAIIPTLSLFDPILSLEWLAAPHDESFSDLHMSTSPLCVCVCVMPCVSVREGKMLRSFVLQWYPFFLHSLHPIYALWESAFFTFRKPRTFLHLSKNVSQERTILKIFGSSPMITLGREFALLTLISVAAKKVGLFHFIQRLDATSVEKQHWDKGWPRETGMRGLWWFWVQWWALPRSQRDLLLVRGKSFNPNSDIFQNLTLRTMCCNSVNYVL